MKYLIILLIPILFACTESEEIEDMTPKDDLVAVIDASEKELLFEGEFVGSGHTTTGKAQVYKDAQGKLTLVFENFKTDSGPDLRIYLANDKRASSYTEITKKVENGNRSYDIPADVNINQKMNVLIWCKLFGVLFGSAELKVKQ